MGKMSKERGAVYIIVVIFCIFPHDWRTELARFFFERGDVKGWKGRGRTRRGRQVAKDKEIKTLTLLLL